MQAMILPARQPMQHGRQVSEVPAAVLESAIPVLKAEVALGWGCMYARRLEASRQHRAGSAALRPSEGQLTSVPDSVR